MRKAPLDILIVYLRVLFGVAEKEEWEKQRRPGQCTEQFADAKRPKFVPDKRALEGPKRNWNRRMGK